MNLKTFKQLEKICKQEWRDLAESGSGNKSNRVLPFINDCPACDISAQAQKVNAKKYRVCEYNDQHCCLCPIDIWREIALEQKRKHKKIPGAACEFKEGLYDVWWTTDSIGQRKRAARLISELSWSFLPEYAKID